MITERCERTREANGLILASPEYNASMPGGLEEPHRLGFTHQTAAVQTSSSTETKLIRLWSIRARVSHQRKLKTHNSRLETQTARFLCTR